MFLIIYCNVNNVLQCIVCEKLFQLRIFQITFENNFINLGVHKKLYRTLYPNILFCWVEVILLLLVMVLQVNL